MRKRVRQHKRPIRGAQLGKTNVDPLGFKVPTKRVFLFIVSAARQLQSRPAPALGSIDAT